MPLLDYDNGEPTPIDKPAPWKDIAVDTVGCVINGHCAMFIAYGIVAGFGPFSGGALCVGGFGLVAGIFTALLRGIAGGPIGTFAIIHFVTLSMQLVGWLTLIVVASVR